MIFNITTTNLIYFTIGLVVMFIIEQIFNLIFKPKKKDKTKTSLPTMKGYITNAHKSLFEANSNLIKLFEVFNEIDNEKP